MQIINHIPFAALGMGTAFTVLWGVADPVAAFAEVKVYTGVGKCTMGDLVTIIDVFVHMSDDYALTAEMG